MQRSRQARPKDQRPREQGEGHALGGHAERGARQLGRRVGAVQNKHGGLTKPQLVLTLRGAGVSNVYNALSYLCHTDTTETHLIHTEADDEADKKIIFVTITSCLNSMLIPPLIPAK